MKKKLINTKDEYFSFFVTDAKADAGKVADPNAEQAQSPSVPDTEKLKEALKCALDIRKFEIELYWKRASYFWVLIGATIVAYVALMTKGSNHVAELSVVVSCLGLIFSCAWLAVNKGSKFWQENWESHVDMLEDKHMGSLYKIVFNNKKSFFSLDGGVFSVSKVNLIVSFYVVFLWLFLLLASISYTWFPNILREYASFLISVGAIASLFFCCYFLFGSVCKSRISFSNEEMEKVSKGCEAKAIRRSIGLE